MESHYINGSTRNYSGMNRLGSELNDTDVHTMTKISTTSKAPYVFVLQEITILEGTDFFYLNGKVTMAEPYTNILVYDNSYNNVAN